MISQDSLNDNALKVLNALRDRSMDGYTLQSATALPKDALAHSLGELVTKSLVKVAGALTLDRIGESFFSVPVDAVGEADSLLGRLTRTSRR